MGDMFLGFCVGVVCTNLAFFLALLVVSSSRKKEERDNQKGL